ATARVSAGPTGLPWRPARLRPAGDAAARLRPARYGPAGYAADRWLPGPARLPAATAGPATAAALSPAAGPAGRVRPDPVAVPVLLPGLAAEQGPDDRVRRRRAAADAVGPDVHRRAGRSAPDRDPRRIPGPAHRPGADGRAGHARSAEHALLPRARAGQLARLGRTETA